ncbi:TetR/AcrR family transcriptional regulator [Allokutzneria sp. NRRL B-24872]|uniref:TetR/AcrR family transcriptional regulator n=1 Tax=Allokutzneria sp. NRRL B-24872 TaxID=1137961 RepID=UPI000A3CF4D1|nr:TetR/AcrR family transcriptional regulator [Allokutzneria sp. NRRL B-24872]
MESRRERKKLAVRRQLADAALRLFSEQGYERTTVAQIAAEADVATKTFFNHFRSKEDVLFADSGPRAPVPLKVLADRQPGETPAQLLLRAYDAMLGDYLTEGVGRHDPESMARFTKLIMSEPALRGRALQLNQEVQRELAAGLLRAFPDTLDEIDAAAAVGAMSGGAQGAALKSLELGQSEEQFWAALRRGVEIGLRGLPD